MTSRNSISGGQQIRQRPVRYGLVLSFALWLALATAVRAEDGTAHLLQRLAAAQAEGLNLLSEQHALEEDLLKPETDRLSVFFSMRNAESVDLAEVAFHLDGALVFSHTYSPTERQRMKKRAVQPLFLGRLPAGLHRMRLDLRLTSGALVPTETYQFTMGTTAKFMEFQLQASPQRTISVLQW